MRTLEVVPAPEPGPEGAGSEDRTFDETPQWPVTRLAAVALTVLVCVCLIAPEAVSGVHGTQRLLLILPAILATVTARVMFEALAPRRPRALRGHLIPAAAAAGVATALLTACVGIVGLPLSVTVAAMTAVAAAVSLVAAGLVRDLEIRVRMALRRVFFVGGEVARRDLEQELARRSDARFVGTARAQGPIDAARLVDAVVDSGATVLVLDHDAMQVAALVDVAAALNLRGVHVRDLVSYYESEFKKVPLAELSPTWFLFDIAPIHRHAWRRLMRRAFELLVSLVLLVLASPALLIAAVAIRLTSRGPVLYRQRRVGIDGAHFTLLKLRTMTAWAGSAEEAAWAGSQDHRVTSVGRVLRRFRLDELPQLWNIVRGDLALVGPRPEQVPIVERLEAEIPFYATRHTVRPGLTGWAQVNLGYSGSVEGTIAKLQRDLYYVKHGGWRLDALILWLTIKAVIAGRG